MYALAWWIALKLLGCATVCPSSWEVGQSVGHSALYGQSYETHVSVGGDIGRECRGDNPAK